MEKTQDLKVSIIIPVHNEEKTIRACIKSIQKQKIQPYELIIVDNNSTDRTYNIVKRFKWIKLIKEEQQGQKFAQFKGFNYAKGDVLVRIDADTILPIDYIGNIVEIFKTNPKIAGVGGGGKSRFEAIPATSKLWNWCYFTYTRAYFGYPIMWGANMAFRRNYWERLKHHLILSDIHEDQDLSLALASVGGRAKIVKDLEVSVNMEGVQHFGKYRHYLWMMRNLKKLDKQNKRASLKRRLKKDNVFLRLLMWLASAWSVYAFYLVTIGYSAYWRFTLFMKTH